MPASYRVEAASASLDEIRATWLTLEPRAEPNFFLSWLWVGAWLETFRPECRLVRIWYGDMLVGSGLLTCRPERRHWLVSSRVLRLMRTGNPHEDQIWIEYNGLLLDGHHALHAPAVFAAYLSAQDFWDEFELGATEAEALSRYRPDSSHPLVKWQAPAYGVDLGRLRAAGCSYLSSLSRNTRYQINHSEKRYGQRGGLRFDVLTTRAQIMAVWPELARLHLDRWGSGIGGSGFACEGFRRFHETLIERGCLEASVELCTLTCDGVLLGATYNFIFGGRVYFYLSGLCYENDRRLKPGLLLHAMVIEHYLRSGLEFYDFMGGDAQYKRSLGQRHCILQMISYQRARPLLMLERLGRDLKRRFAKTGLEGGEND